MIEHSCVANCTFAPVSDTLSLQAIDTIKPGTALSICYSGSYMPCKLRKLGLRCTYGRFPTLCCVQLVSS
jgi:hypothetical protein